MDSIATALGIHDVNLDYFFYGSVLVPLKMYINGGWNQWSARLADKVIVITGANAGIGYECARELAALRPKAIVMACRDDKRGKEAVASIKGQGHFCCEFMKLDLNDLESV